MKPSRMDQVKFFKGCLPQILLGPFLNTLSHMPGHIGLKSQATDEHSSQLNRKNFYNNKPKPKIIY